MGPNEKAEAERINRHANRNILLAGKILRHWDEWEQEASWAAATEHDYEAYERVMLERIEACLNGQLEQ